MGESGKRCRNPGRMNLRCCLFAFLAGMGCSAFAEGYPERPVRLVVPQAAGSATDTVARILAAELPNQLGQPVVVENKPGGALTIGLDFTAKSAPDGYTIGMGPVGAPHGGETSL
jgi:tripartite-type tricarboxylate transporter receptor subunit TctC